jgi:uncharacterized protein YdeI (BOF family)
LVYDLRHLQHAKVIEMSDHENIDRNALPPSSHWKPKRRLAAASALAIVLIAGAALGAGGTRIAQQWQPQRVMLLQPAAIDKMVEGAPVAIKGEVTDVFGGKFVLQDATGRALVDAGPRGEDRVTAAKGETVAVQGRFDRGVVHPDVISHADGRNEAFGPPGPPKGPKDPKGSKGLKDGPRADHTPPPSPTGGDAGETPAAAVR